MTDRELNTLAAEKVMGWVRRKGSWYETFRNDGEGYWIRGIRRADLESMFDCFCPATSIADAMDLEEKLSDSFRITIEHYSDGWYVRFTERKPTGRSRVYKAVQIGTLPRAILHAALRVVGESPR